MINIDVHYSNEQGIREMISVPDQILFSRMQESISPYAYSSFFVIVTTLPSTHAMIPSVCCGPHGRIEIYHSR